MLGVVREVGAARGGVRDRVAVQLEGGVRGGASSKYFEGMCRWWPVV